MRSGSMRSGWLVVVLLTVAASGAGADPKAGAAPAAGGEPVWKSVLLAPGRIVGHGRFDAAAPSYHARRAAEKSAIHAERTAAQCDCECSSPR